MSFDELVAALVGLNKFLLRPVMAIILHEHFLLWSWCAELLIGGHATGQPNNIRHVEPLFFATIRAALASAPPRLKLPGNDPQFLNAAEFLSTANIVFAHMSFPLLEAVCKRACSYYVTIDGKVIAQFQVPRQSKSRTYLPGDDCSSLRDLLWLHHNHVALARAGRVARTRNATGQGIKPKCLIETGRRMGYSARARKDITPYGS